MMFFILLVIFAIILIAILFTNLSKDDKNKPDPLINFHPHCIRCGYPLLHEETTCPKCGIQIQISPEELAKQQRIYLANNNAFGKVANAMQSTSNGLEKAGSGMTHVGCMLTIFITIPILIILYFI